ncbi:MAG: type II toxin-antitoxin system VapC family toxin [Caulobacterales bacterium]
MILADTSVWIDHLRQGDAAMAVALEAGEVLIHPFVIGEISLGTLGQRAVTLELLNDLPSAIVASAEEVAALIERERLFGSGVGYVDVHLLASVRLTTDATFWTRDLRLRAVAERLGLPARRA